MWRAVVPFVLLSTACIENQVGNRPGEPDPPRPAIEVTPTQLDFGLVPNGIAQVRTFTIASVGTDDLIVGDVTLDAPAFTFLDPPPLGSLPPGEEVAVDVVIQGDGVEHFAMARVFSDDAAQPVVGVDLIAGTQAPILRIEPKPLDFGAGGVGVPIERDATLRNDGDAPLSIDGFQIDGQHFEMVWHDPLPIVLDPTEESTITMAYTAPALEVENTGILWVDSNAAISDSPVPLLGTSDYAAVEGRICNPADAGWVAGARVWADVDTNGDTVIDYTTETWTDGDGRFTLDKLVSGPQTIHVEKGRFETSFVVEVPAGGTYEMPDDECLDQGELEIAVIPGVYDDIGALLTSIGLTYTVESPALLQSASSLADYDMVFVACAAVVDPFEIDASAIAAYVEAGNGFYASDLTLYAMAAIWPDEFSAGFGGAYSSTTVTLLDPNMEALVGSSTLTINYETGVNPVLLDGDDDVTSDVLIPGLRVHPGDHAARVRRRNGDLHGVPHQRHRDARDDGPVRGDGAVAVTQGG